MGLLYLYLSFHTISMEERIYRYIGGVLKAPLFQELLRKWKYLNGNDWVGPGQSCGGLGQRAGIYSEITNCT